MRQSTEYRAINNPRQLQQERYGNREYRDCGFEDPVNKDWPSNPVHYSCRYRSTERQSSHVGSENSGYSQLGRPENDRQLPHPGGLVQQGSETGQKKAQTDGNKDDQTRAVACFHADILINVGIHDARNAKRPGVAGPFDSLIPVYCFLVAYLPPKFASKVTP